MDLIDKKIYGSWDYEPSGDVGILDVAPDLLRGIVDGVIRAGNNLLVEVPQKSKGSELWTALCSNELEATYRIDRLLRSKADSTTYPYAVWCFPSARRTDSVQIISDFYTDRMNLAPFTKFLELGGQRLSGFRSSLTYNVRFEALEAARSLVLAATRGSKVQYVWESDRDTD